MTNNEMLVAMDVVLNLLLECPYIPKDKKPDIDILRLKVVTKALKRNAYNDDTRAREAWSCMQAVKDLIKEKLNWEQDEPFRKMFWEKDDESD